MKHKKIPESQSDKSQTLRERFAANLRTARDGQNLSQEKLAEMAGFHRTYVSSVERCMGNISLDNVERLADALQIDAEVLFKKI